MAPVSNSTTVLIALYNCEITLTQITHFVYSGTILHIHIKYYVNNKSELKIISYSIIYKDKMTAESMRYIFLQFIRGLMPKKLPIFIMRVFTRCE